MKRPRMDVLGPRQWRQAEGAISLEAPKLVHDDYQHEHVKYDGCLISHPSLLLCAAESRTITNA